MAVTPKLPTDARRDRPAIGLVLGGGGIAGYAFHCGILAALADDGFDPRTAELVVGTSAGAITGALTRGGVPARDIRDRLLNSIDDPVEMAKIRLLAGRSRRAIPQVWTGPSSTALAMAEIRKGRGLRLTRFATGLLPRGRLDLDPVSEPLDNLFGSSWPERPLWLPATELATGRRIVFGRELRPPVAEAVAASAALPGFFAPARIGNRSYVDGGIGSPFNLDLVLDYRPVDERPLDLVVMVAPLSLHRMDRSSPLNTVARALPRRRLKSEVARVADAGVPVLAIEPDRPTAKAMGLNPMDHHDLDQIIARATELAEDRLANVRASVRAILDRARKLPRPADVAYPTT
ncbi:MAG: patatin-like phospholipase family protein [Actinomycetota bacterium]